MHNHGMAHAPRQAARSHPPCASRAAANGKSLEATSMRKAPSAGGPFAALHSSTRRPSLHIQPGPFAALHMQNMQAKPIHTAWGSQQEVREPAVLLVTLLVTNSQMARRQPILPALMQHHGRCPQSKAQSMIGRIGTVQQERTGKLQEFTFASGDAYSVDALEDWGRQCDMWQVKGDSPLEYLPSRSPAEVLQLQQGVESLTIPTRQPWVSCTCLCVRACQSFKAAQRTRVQEHSGRYAQQKYSTGAQLIERLRRYQPSRAR